MLLIVPGRHHLLTNFQFDYLRKIVVDGVQWDPNFKPTKDQTIAQVSGIIFVVTSANHHGTKRNPIPFHLRSLAIHDFGYDWPVPVFVYGINDVGRMDNFASYLIKNVDHISNYRFDLSPKNTVVVSSTVVARGFQKLGYGILPAERADRKIPETKFVLPWKYIERIAASPEWKAEEKLLDHIHPSTIKIWAQYELGKLTKEILNDPIIGEDGDLTESRDYGSYVRKMDEISTLKFEETAPFIQAGNIGDIGCAVGSWIKHASHESRLHESDFYGIELSRQLFSLCENRKAQQEFGNPNVYFKMKNAVNGLVFKPNSMNTIHTGSLTHEIESYGSREDLLKFIQNRYEELKPQGVWINRDVVGPENGDQEVLLWLNDSDGSSEDPFKNFTDRMDLSAYLKKLSTANRFLRFAKNFRKKYHDSIRFQLRRIEDQNYYQMRLKDASEFLLTKDYTDNWDSEMNERFCNWSFSDWKKELEKTGFHIAPESQAYQNSWIVENRMIGKARLFDLELMEQKFPVTNLLMVGVKA